MVASVVLPTLLGVADMAAVAATLGTFGAAAAAFAVNFAVSMIVVRVFGQDQQKPQDTGTREQVPPANSNAIPIVYGDAYLGGTFVDAVLSTDQKTMYYVMAVSCVSPNGQFYFDFSNFYYGERLVTFSASGGVTQAKIYSNGSGYAVGNVLTVSGGSGTPAQLTVTGVSAGKITSVSISTAGGYSYGNTPNNPVSVTGGSGTGAKFILKYTTYGPTVQALSDESGNIDTSIGPNSLIQIFAYTSNQAGTVTPLNTIDQPWSVMGGTDIASDLRWPSTGRRMNGLAFAIIRLSYSSDVGTTSLSPITFHASHYLNGANHAKPGDVWYDYITNKQYGGAIGWLPDGSFSTDFVDTASVSNLNTYSDELITFNTYTGSPSTQARYRMNGVLDAGKPVLENLDKIMTSCDCWMAYNAASGKWSIVINKAETPSFSFNDTNIIGEIRVSATDITQSINQVEAKFPNSQSRDQPDFVNLATPSALLYPNEPVNKYSVNYDLVNNSVQAQYLANRILEQAREDLIVSFNTTYYGIQVDAGDVVSVTNSDYGWTNKLFRVVKVNEASLPDGSLGARLEMTEYSAAVYDNANITEYTPVPNSGLPSPSFFSALSAPTVTSNNPTNAIPNFNITVSVPATGRVTIIELYYTTSASPTVSDLKLLSTANLTDGSSYTPSSSFVFSNLVLPTGSASSTTYYFGYLVRNEFSSSFLSPLSSSFNWNPVTNPANFIPGNMTTGSSAQAWIQMGQNGTVIAELKSSFNVRKIAVDTTLVNIAAQNNMDGNVTIWGHSANNAVGSGNGVSGSHVTLNTFSYWQRIGVLGSGVANAGVWGVTYADNTDSLGGRFERYSGTNSNSPGTLSKSIQLATSTYSAYSPSGQGKIYIVDGTGPFTGFHEGMFPIEAPVEIGDIVTDVSVFYRANISNVLFNVESSNSANESRVLGVVSAILPVQTNTPGILWEPVEIYEENELAPCTTMQLIPGYNLEELQTTYKVVQINAVGEGQINVCGEGGNIQAGDLIVSSSIAGKGMKQSDNIVRSITVAKARESVNFSSPSEVQMIACIYLGG